jgi:hypothetical protein
MDKIKPLYAELIGYLAEAPDPKDNYGSIYDSAFWSQYNNTVNSLTKISGKDYSTFCIQPKDSGFGSPCIMTTTYRQKLSGLIHRLHSEYFKNEPHPTDRNKPGVVVTQTQQQTQVVFNQVLLDIQDKINEQISNYKDGSKEKGFLQKLKGTLSGATNIVQLFNLIFTLAKEYGFSIDQLSNFFK